MLDKKTKIVQKDKKFCLSPSISQETYIIWLSSVVLKCKMMISVGFFFFHFFKILIFQVDCKVKGQRMAQSDKKLFLSHSLSQEPYLIWLWFLVHMRKMMISPEVFFTFSKFWFFRFLGRGVKGKKMIQNYHFQSVTLYILRTIDHIITIFGTQL